MKSLIRKNIADRLLRKYNYLGTGSPVKWDFSKGSAGITYHPPLLGRDIVVTVNCLQAPLLREFGALKHEHQYHRCVADPEERGEFPTDSCQIDLEGTGQYLRFGGSEDHPTVALPLYVLETEVLAMIEPGASVYGELRGQCKNAMQIWADSDIKTAIAPQFGFIEAERAREYWRVVVKLRRLNLLHPLINYVLEQPDSGMYIPAFSVPNFGMLGDELIPAAAVHSLGVHAAINRKSLYEG